MDPCTRTPNCSRVAGHDGRCSVPGADAPPSVRLSDLDPEAVAREVCAAVEAHVQSLAFALGRSLVYMGPANLDQELQAVVLWAQTGRWISPAEAPDPDTAHALAWDALTQVVCVLYSTPLDGTQAPVTPLTAEADPDTAIGVAVVAAVCRADLLQGQAVTPHRLAPLASLSQRQIERLAAAGELPRDAEGTIPAEAARAWLRGRGVEGV